LFAGVCSVPKAVCNPVISSWVKARFQMPMSSSCLKEISGVVGFSQAPKIRFPSGELKFRLQG